jgi:hypothetical protein
MKTPNTKQVARQLKIAPQNLLNKIWNGRLPRPPRGGNGRYIWTNEAINAAREALEKGVSDES